MYKKIELVDGFIFSPIKDIMIFWMPVFFVMCTIFFWGGQTDSDTRVISSVWFYIGVYFVNAAHIFATLPAVWVRYKIGWVKETETLAFILLSAIYFFVFYTNLKIFYSLLATMTVFHLLRQQYGWMMISRKKCLNDSSSRLGDQVILWGSALAAIAWWISNASGMPKSYFTDNDLLLWQKIIPQEILSISKPAFYFFLLLFMIKTGYDFLRHKAINYGKTIFLLSNFFWFSILVAFDRLHQFFMALIYIHGVAYLQHVLSNSRKIVSNKWAELSGVVMFMFGFLFLISAPWHYYENWAYSIGGQFGRQTILEAIAWYPLLPHYFFDALMWKSERQVKIM